ncbi:MAG: DUF2284 domain-containing protein [Ruthenibacterium sp.]
MNTEEMIATTLSLGAAHAAVLSVKDIPFEREFRKMCEQNACGMYGKSWMCPPFVGEIDTLIAQAQHYQTALVYQTIGTLEDSYDFEGMMEAGAKMNALTQKLRAAFDGSLKNALHLGAGGCRVCEKCAKRDEKPCRFPEQALSSLEAYGISVSQLAALCDMKYINGQNTVTYFGAILFD